MITRRTVSGMAFFAAGLIAGLALDNAVAPARADSLNWKEIAGDPAFRAAVIEVVDSCIVDNGIIYCN